MRVHTVKHSLTALKCSRCGTAIKPSRDETVPATPPRKGKKVQRVLGDPYRWIKFKGQSRRVRCMAAGCGFRTSEMTSSEKLSRVYAAQESAEDALATFDPETGDASDLATIRDDMANELREVAQEYTDSADNMEQSFTGGSPTIDDCREKAENLEAWEPEEWEPEEPEEDEKPEEQPDDDGPRDDSGRTQSEWGEAQREALSEIVGNCPL